MDNQQKTHDALARHIGRQTIDLIAARVECASLQDEVSKLEQKLADLARGVGEGKAAKKPDQKED